MNCSQHGGKGVSSRAGEMALECNPSTTIGKCGFVELPQKTWGGGGGGRNGFIFHALAAEKTHPKHSYPSRTSPGSFAKKQRSRSVAMQIKGVSKLSELFSCFSDVPPC